MTGLAKLIVTMAVALCSTACVLPLEINIEDDDAVEGTGVVVTQTWKVSGFDAVEILGVGDVTITKGGREGLTITGEENILDLIDVKVDYGSLYVAPRSGVNLQPNHDLIMDITVRELRRVEGSGAVGLTVFLGWEERLEVEVSGACTVKVHGSVDVLDLTASGATRFRGRELIARVANLVVSGVAGAVVHATERLNATASGVAWIRYLGNPVLDLDTSGLATVGPY
jgi:hypothetical protein